MAPHAPHPLPISCGFSSGQVEIAGINRLLHRELLAMHTTRRRIRSRNRTTCISTVVESTFSFWFDGANRVVEQRLRRGVDVQPTLGDPVGEARRARGAPAARSEPATGSARGPAPRAVPGCRRGGARRSPRPARRCPTFCAATILRIGALVSACRSRTVWSAPSRSALLIATMSATSSRPAFAA